MFFGAYANFLPNSENLKILPFLDFEISTFFENNLA